MILDLLRSLLPARRLAPWGRPRRVSFEATIASENTLVGPFTGLRGALVDVALFSVRTGGEGGMEPPERHVERLVSLVYAPERLSIACPGGTLEVPRRSVRLELHDPGYGTPVDRPLPPELAHVLETRADHGLLHARELILSKGDRVRVRGTVVHADRGEATSDYRTLRATPSYTAGDDLVLVDVSLG